MQSPLTRMAVVGLALLGLVGALLVGASGADATTTPWHPRPGVSWQWQLSGRVDTTVRAQVYDVDGFDTSATTVARLHAQGRRVVCYLSAGSWEDWRPDAGTYPASVLGRPLDGWPGERWLDVRQLDVLRPLLARRMTMCAAKGFDAVEPDNVDGYANRTGFAVSAAQQLAFNRMLARLAHARHLAVALKNDVDQIPSLVRSFDFAVNEQCVVYDECSAYRPFVRAGKAVLHVEYQGSPAFFCAATTRLGLSSLRKHDDLGSWRRACSR